MKQTIIINGAIYEDVPVIRTPTPDGGVVSYVEISDTTAKAENVEAGKIFYSAAGSYTEGTLEKDQPLTTADIDALFKETD